MERKPARGRVSVGLFLASDHIFAKAASWPWRGATNRNRIQGRCGQVSEPIITKLSESLLLKLIGRYLRVGVIVDGELQLSAEEAPQGGSLSPLLANILLDELDKKLEQRRLPFVRYAGDFVIFTKSKRAARRVFRPVQCFLTERLRHIVNETKSKVIQWQEPEFLRLPFGGSLRATP